MNDKVIIDLFMFRHLIFYPAGIYLFKVNNGNTWTMFEKKKKKKHENDLSNVVLINFE